MRFLRNLVKETDSHNAALLAREAAESKARLHSMEKKEEKPALDIRKRQLGLIAAHLTGGPKKSGYKAEDSSKRRRRDTSSGDENRDRRNRSKRTGREDESGRRKDRAEDVKRSRHRDYRDRSENDHCHRTRGSRSRSQSSAREDRKSRHRHRSHHRRKSRSRSGEQSHNEDRRERRRQNAKDDLPRHKSERQPRQRESEEDSDPLDDIIGPRPPPAPKFYTKGRGLISSAAGIDSRFSSDYDPTADVALDPEEENDWDQALEALRDRQKFKQHGANRLRAAGFTEEEVAKWEKGGSGEKSEADVRWAKKGETKEWDRGKVDQSDLAMDDIIVRKRTPDVDLSFGRLKDDW